jgi:hypothetical protein
MTNFDHTFFSCIHICMMIGHRHEVMSIGGRVDGWMDGWMWEEGVALLTMNTRACVCVCVIMGG